MFAWWKKYNLYSVGLTDRKLCVSTKYKLQKTKKQLSYRFNKFISCTHSTMFNLLWSMIIHSYYFRKQNKVELLSENPMKLGMFWCLTECSISASFMKRRLASFDSPRSFFITTFFSSEPWTYFAEWTEPKLPTPSSCESLTFSQLKWGSPWLIFIFFPRLRVGNLKLLDIPDIVALTIYMR
jgi:hypothetical protein